MDSIVETRIAGRCKDSVNKGFYLSLGGSLLFHLALLAFLFPSSLNSYKAQQASRIIVVSLESGSWDAAPGSSSAGTKTPVTVEPEVTRGVQETDSGIADRTPNEKNTARKQSSESEKEDIRMTEEAVARPPGSSTQPVRHAGTPEGDQAQDTVPAGPPAETMLAFAGGDLTPGILSSGSLNGQSDRFIPAVTVSLPEPSYPRVCRRRGQEGTVVLSVAIGADGRPGKISVADTSGFVRLDRAASDALKKAVFGPARRSGVAVESIRKIAYTFRIEDEDN